MQPIDPLQLDTIPKEMLDPSTIADLLDLAKDRQNFFLQRGIDPDDPDGLNRFYEISLGIDPSGKIWQRFLDFHRYWQKLIDQILSLPEMRKLRFIQQVSGKLSPASFQKVWNDSTTQRIQMIEPHLGERFSHVKIVANLCLLTGLYLKLSDQELLLLYLAALLHDLGHPSFSHDGETFLMWYFEQPNHETRTVSLLQQLGLDDAIDIILNQDKSGLGEILSVIDTLAYLEHDSKGFELSFDNSLAPRFIKSIKLMQNGKLIFNDTLTLKEMLRYRYILYRDIYYHPANNIKVACLHNLLEFMTDHNFLDYLHLLDKIPDREIMHTIQNLRDSFRKFGYQSEYNLFQRLYTGFLGFDNILAGLPDWESIFLGFNKVEKICGNKKPNPKIIKDWIRQVFSDYFQIHKIDSYNFLVVPPGKLGKIVTAQVDGQIEKVEYRELETQKGYLGYLIYFPKNMSHLFFFLKLKIDYL